jgi:hypothetical protein
LSYTSAEPRITSPKEGGEQGSGDSGLSRGAISGIVIAALLAVAASVFATWWFWKRDGESDHEYQVAEMDHDTIAGGFDAWAAEGEGGTMDAWGLASTVGSVDNPISGLPGAGGPPDIEFRPAFE